MSENYWADVGSSDSNFQEEERLTNIELSVDELFKRSGDILIEQRNIQKLTEDAEKELLDIKIDQTDIALKLEDINDKVIFMSQNLVDLLNIVYAIFFIAIIFLSILGVFRYIQKKQKSSIYPAREKIIQQKEGETASHDGFKSGDIDKSIAMQASEIVESAENPNLELLKQGFMSTSSHESGPQFPQSKKMPPIDLHKIFMKDV